MAKEIFITRSITINRSPQEVFDYLKLLKNQEHFSVWNMADPNKNTKETGTDGTEGFIYEWDSKLKNVGAGSQQISKIEDGKSIESKLIFIRPMKNTGTSKFIVERNGDQQTTVFWEFRGPTKFPMSLLKSLFEKMLGKDIQASLEHLKKNLES